MGLKTGMESEVPRALSFLHSSKSPKSYFLLHVFHLIFLVNSAAVMTYIGDEFFLLLSPLYICINSEMSPLDDIEGEGSDEGKRDRE